MISFILPFCHSVCTPSCLYNSITIRSIDFKFGEQILHGVHMDYSKFGEIRVKIIVRRQFILYSIGHIQRNLLFFFMYVNQYHDPVNIFRFCKRLK